jgi:predicted CoA-substrate-specific enzyme activase
MIVVAGLDVGSGGTKCVLMDAGRKVLGKAAVRTRANFEEVAREAFEGAVTAAGLRAADVAYVATTGLGRYSISFRDVQITDITCGARGAWFLFPTTRFVLDIGAQSTRAIRLQEGGRVREFHCNEKCAAGSGGFLERAARYLEVPVAEIGALSAGADSAQAISSVCAVLAETEIINHVSDGATPDRILRGVHESLADRAMSLLKRVGYDGGLTLIGGVARQAGMAKAARAKLGADVNVPDDPHFACALGACLLAFQRLARRRPGVATSTGREA